MFIRCIGARKQFAPTVYGFCKLAQPKTVSEVILNPVSLFQIPIEKTGCTRKRELKTTSGRRPSAAFWATCGRSFFLVWENNNSILLQREKRNAVPTMGISTWRVPLGSFQAWFAGKPTVFVRNGRGFRSFPIPFHIFGALILLTSIAAAVAAQRAASRRKRL